MMNAVYKEAKTYHDSALALDARITDFYNEVVRRSGQISRNPRSAVPIHEFTNLNLALNKEHAHIAECWDWLVQEIIARLSAAISDVGSNVYPPAVQGKIAAALDEHFNAVRTLFIDDAASNPVGKAMQDKDDKQDTLNMPRMPLPKSTIEKVDALLMDMLKALRTIELELTGADASKLTQAIEAAVTNLRLNGLLPRSFSWDLSAHVRTKVKQAYGDIDTLLESPASLKIERADWASDIMNALTVAIIEIRDSDTHSSDAQMHFETLLCLAEQMSKASLDYASMSKDDWMVYLQSCEQTIAGLALGGEAKADLQKALKRLHLGSQTDKEKVTKALDTLASNIRQSGWFNLPYCDVLMLSRSRLIQTQNLIGRSLQKQCMDAKKVLESIASAHEAVFNVHLLQNSTNTAVNRWCREKLAEMQALRDNLGTKGISSFDVLLFEQRYRNFWGTFIKELEERYFEASVLLGRRSGYRDVRKHTTTALEDLASQGEMLFQFKDCKLQALLRLLAENWDKAYRLSPVKKDAQRISAYEKLKTRLQSAQSEMQALHYLSQSAQCMLGAHAQTSLAHNLTLWEKPSRGAEAVRQTLVDATRLGLFPEKIALPFEQTINIVRSTLGRFFASLWFVNRSKQKHVYEVMSVIADERGKLLVSDGYGRESAETAVLNAIRRRYEQEKTSHDNKISTAVLRFMGYACKDPYVEIWRAVYQETARERQLSLVAKPMVLEKLKALATNMVQMPVATNEQVQKKKQGIETINQLIERIERGSFHLKSGYLNIQRVRPELEALELGGLVDKFDAVVSGLVSQGFIEKCKPKANGLTRLAENKLEDAQRLADKTKKMRMGR